MSWEVLDPPKSTGGIWIGHKAISFSKETVRGFSATKWDYVKIEYDKEKKMIRFTKSVKNEGYRVSKRYAVTAKITKLVPLGRYLQSESGKDELIFIHHTR